VTTYIKQAFKHAIRSAMITEQGPVVALIVKRCVERARGAGASPQEIYEICRDGLCGGPSCHNPRCPGWVLAYGDDGYPPMIDRCDDCYTVADRDARALGVPDPMASEA